MAQALKNAFFGEGVGDIFVDDVICNGTERSLQECRFSSEHNCNHSEDAGVMCEGESSNVPDLHCQNAIKVWRNTMFDFSEYSLTFYQVPV